MNKKIGFLMVTGMGLLLAGCGNQANNKAANSSSASSSSLLVAKSNVKVAMRKHERMIYPQHVLIWQECLSIAGIFWRHIITLRRQ